MARKGLRRKLLSKYCEIEAGDELRIPKLPFLAILRVVASCFLSMNQVNGFLKNAM